MKADGVDVENGQILAGFSDSARVNLEDDAPHRRTLVLRWEKGAVELTLDQGVGSWQPTERCRFDFARNVDDQVQPLLRAPVKVKNFASSTFAQACHSRAELTFLAAGAAAVGNDAKRKRPCATAQCSPTQRHRNTGRVLCSLHPEARLLFAEVAVRSRSENFSLAGALASNPIEKALPPAIEAVGPAGESRQGLSCSSCREDCVNSFETGACTNFRPASPREGENGNDVRTG